ncbi:hypothetical protein FMEXI_1665 [Fusarium mexicanum]|uniref:Uncharacterized protein n=1 Tax=Fusarium mexicanum TaxID=751941 RepID=A0A8H5N813_9HYPO|nr:hypothetical protein FMEXI_1665 [Fusarium mexicanum]
MGRLVGEGSQIKFNGKLLSELATKSSRRMHWLPQDRVAMEQWLRANHTTAFLEDTGDASLDQLALTIGLDFRILDKDQKRVAKAKMCSSLKYTLNKLKISGEVSERWDPEGKRVVLDWRQSAGRYLRGLHDSGINSLYPVPPHHPTPRTLTFNDHRRRAPETDSTLSSKQMSRMYPTVPPYSGRVTPLERELEQAPEEFYRQKDHDDQPPPYTVQANFVETDLQRATEEFFRQKAYLDQFEDLISKRYKTKAQDALVQQASAVSRTQRHSQREVEIPMRRGQTARMEARTIMAGGENHINLEIRKTSSWPLTPEMAERKSPALHESDSTRAHRRFVNSLRRALDEVVCTRADRDFQQRLANAFVPDTLLVPRRSDQDHGALRQRSRSDNKVLQRPSRSDHKAAQQRPRFITLKEPSPGYLHPDLYAEGTELSAMHLNEENRDVPLPHNLDTQQQHPLLQRMSLASRNKCQRDKVCSCGKSSGPSELLLHVPVASSGLHRQSKQIHSACSQAALTPLTDASASFGQNALSSDNLVHGYPTTTVLALNLIMSPGKKRCETCNKSKADSAISRMMTMIDARKDAKSGTRESEDYQNLHKYCDGVSIGQTLSASEYLYLHRDAKPQDSIIVCTMAEAANIFNTGPPNIPVLIVGTPNPRRLKIDTFLAWLTCRDTLHVHDFSRPSEKGRSPISLPSKDAKTLFETRDKMSGPALNFLNLRGTKDHAGPDCITNMYDYKCIEISSVDNGKIETEALVGDLDDSTRFQLLASIGAIHLPHIDRHGVFTTVLNEQGEKIWLVWPNLGLDVLRNWDEEDELLGRKVGRIVHDARRGTAQLLVPVHQDSTSSVPRYQAPPPRQCEPPIHRSRVQQTEAEIDQASVPNGVI